MRLSGNRWAMMIVAFLAVSGAIGLGRFGYSALLPSMQGGLGLSNTAAGSLASWNLVGYTVMSALGGFLAFRFGPSRVILVGMVLTAAGMLETGLASGLLTASAGRLVTGLGNGLVNVPSIAMMVSWFEVRQRGVAAGIVGSGPSLGLVFAGVFVPRLIASSGWRAGWYFYAATTVVLALVVLVLLRDRVRPGQLAGTKQPKVSGDDWRGVLVSRHAWLLGLIYFFFGLGYVTYLTFFQKRLIHDLDYTSQGAGLFFTVMGAVSLVSGFLWGYLSDRIGRRRAIVIMCLLQAAASALFGLRPSGPSLMASAVLIGLTSLSIPGILGAACGDHFGSHMASVSLGFVTVLLGIAMAVGPIIGGMTADAYSSFAPSYVMAAVFFALSAVLALVLPKTRSGLGQEL
jgi:predicted MFS family arabinose efflux permease